jgi:hypothetical protein
MQRRIIKPEEPMIGDIRMPIDCEIGTITLKRSSGGVPTWILEKRKGEYNYMMVNMTKQKEFEELWNLIESWSTGVKKC